MKIKVKCETCTVKVSASYICIHRFVLQNHSDLGNNLGDEPYILYGIIFDVISSDPKITKYLSEIFANLFLYTVKSSYNVEQCELFLQGHCPRKTWQLFRLSYPVNSAYNIKCEITLRQASVYQHFSCSTQLSMTFIIIIYVKMPASWHFNILLA